MVLDPAQGIHKATRIATIDERFQKITEEFVRKKTNGAAATQAISVVVQEQQDV